MPPISNTEPLAVYLHWPYCARICPYCDFNVHLDRRAGEGVALVQAMVADLEHWRDWTGPRSIGSIHFGGGTPSLLSGEQLSTLIRTVERLWTVDDAEIAIEANPNDVTQNRLDAWSQAGLTRLSLGVQSFDDAVLKRLGRDHDGASARRAVEAAMDLFSSVSADLIFGVLGEEAGRLQSDLQTLLDLRVPHISTYQLTIEPGTAFARAEARGDMKAVDEEASASGFDLILATLGAQGYRHYEVSNFAKPGHESRHNLAYWRGQDYVGVGPGAHGRLWTDAGRVATETALRPADYIAQVDKTGSGLTEQESLSPDAAAEEYVLMGLRIEEGLSLERVAAIRGRPLSVDPDLIEAAWLTVEGDCLRATSKGRIVLDALTRALLL
ncbi:MAG: radical SAM family heme chaperone HemW [Pseudomonadota bacterium]